MDQTPSSALPLVFVGGDPSVDLVNSVDWTVRGPENERLTSYRRWLQWALGANVVAAADAERLRSAAAVRPADAEAALDRAHEARRVLHQLFTAVVEGGVASVIGPFNTLLAEALARSRLSPPHDGGSPGSPLAWRWRAMGEDLESPLWPVLWRAAHLLTGPEAGKLRVCDGTDCGWVYVDRSRNGLRRWCQMETCGTRAKSRRRAERNRRARVRR